MKLSLKRYLLSAIKWLSAFLGLEILICLFYLLDTKKSSSFIIINVMNFVILLPIGIYYLSLFFFFKKKCKDLTPKEAVVANWAAGSFRYTGKIIVKQDEEEYSTASYFSQEEAKNLVGKTVLYAIISDTLIIYEIKEAKEESDGDVLSDF